MNIFQRKLKQATVILIVVFFIFAIVYLITRPPEDRCTNGVQDNYETGVDCGGFCAAVCAHPDKPDSVNDIEIRWVRLLENGRDRYTFVADLANENASWGVSGVEYVFTYYDVDGKVIGTRQGITSIMPRGNTNNDSVRYLIEDGISSSTRIKKLDLALSNYHWEEVEDATDVDNLNENIIRISDKNFGIDSMTKAYTATGTTKNMSKYDFYQVEIQSVVFGENDEVLAAGKTTQFTLAAGRGWGFFVAWPNLKVDGSNIKNVDYRAVTNVFDKNNFLKAYRANE